MQFLLLIYDDEKRWNKDGKPDYGSELEEYRAFTKQLQRRFRAATLCRQPLPPKPSVCATANLWPPMGRSPRPRSSSPGTTWWKQAMQTRRSALQARSPGRGMDRLKCVRS